MEIKVLYKGSNGSYVVQKGGYFYLLNIYITNKPLKMKRAESFFRFGFFERVVSVDNETLNKIKQQLTSY